MLLIVGKSFACSCDTPKPAIEFYESHYVFEGEVIEKIYASDSLTNTVTFEISKHYKDGDNPQFLKFKLNSEAEVTGLYSSCYWTAKKGDKWLVYAKKKDGELDFQFFCSNSKPLGRLKIYPSEQKVLDNGNKLDLNQYRYTAYSAKPITNVDSILEKYQNQKFAPSKTFASVWLDIDKHGNLKKANLHPNQELEYEEIDTIFGMNQFKNVYREPNSDLEKTALEIAEKIKEWEKYYYLDLEEPVKYRKWLKIYVDKDSILQVE
ncbi:hypothetical protein RM549_12615 [Salegentibacter sp. F188]|uniref:Tissue inhibitor of metalloproteinase n=1 Tax=Autumnicola patrickiae TaxID=3075591 RepID=A0ABU3E3Q9_9FLAO|nr:hypothetical protein [Salegentibacter sp. F188]MDT0690634.1 hypothetical protein [Salegentibacter sp. F188]